MKSPNRGRASAALAAALAALAAGCAGGDQYVQTTFRPVTEYGELLNALFRNTLYWTMAILVVVLVLIVYVMVRFRERPGQPAPKQIHGNTTLEIAWTVIPALIVVAMAVPTVGAIFRTQARPPADALEIEVIGHQWWWEFRYPEYGVTTANQIYVPVGRPVHLRLHSADVIHSFWLPRFGGKRDVNPRPRTAEGEQPRDNHIVFTVEEPGIYRGQCAEFCGASHAIMMMSAVAVPADEFEAWTLTMKDTPAPATPTDTLAGAATPAQGGTLAPGNEAAQNAAAAAAGQAGAPDTRGTLSAEPGAGQADLANVTRPRTTLAQDLDPALVAQGKAVFLSKQCVICHSIANTTAKGIIGPSLTRIGDRPTIGAGALPNTPENLVRWITNPRSIKAGALMPGTQVGAPAPSAPNGPPFPPTGLTDEEVRAVAAYLSSLR